MLAPQYSLRRLMALVTFSAFGCLIVAAAVRGHMWALAVVVAMLGLVVTIGCYGLLYLIARGIGAALDRRKGVAEAGGTRAAGP